MEKTDLKTQLAEVAERIRTMREITGLSEGEMAKCTGVPPGGVPAVRGRGEGLQLHLYLQVRPALWH